MSRHASDAGALCTRCLPSGEARYSVVKSPPGPRRSNGVESICIIHKPSMHQPDRSRSTEMHHWGDARRILSEHPGWVIPLLRRGQPTHTISNAPGCRAAVRPLAGVWYTVPDHRPHGKENLENFRRAFGKRVSGSPERVFIHTGDSESDRGGYSARANRLPRRTIRRRTSSRVRSARRVSAARPVDSARSSMPASVAASASQTVR